MIKKIKMFHNEVTGKLEFDTLVKIVNKKEIYFLTDKYIGYVEYDNGEYLEIYDCNGELHGYYEKIED